VSCISSRIYIDEKDLQIMLDLLVTVRPLEHLNDYPVKVNIEENLALPAVRANTRLWFDGGQPIGWAYVDEFNNLQWALEKQCEELIGTQMIEWGISCVQKTLIKGKSTTLDASCREDYSTTIAFLERFAFQQTSDTTISMRRDLFEPIPEPRLPQGFTIRSMKGLHEAGTVAAMHRAAFGTGYMTAEHRRVIMNTSGYDPTLDLLVTAPDGAIAANCICSVNETSKIGRTDPVATHPAYQRRGLARALLLTGLQRLRERSMLFADLGTSGENIAMQKTAESVGFRVDYKTIWFSKKVC
jgi:mycothiol synthase